MEAEELRKHCTLRELKKIEIKDAIMAHLGDADLSSSGAGEVNQRLVQDLLSKHQVQNDAAEVREIIADSSVCGYNPNVCAIQVQHT